MHIKNNLLGCISMITSNKHLLILKKYLESHIDEKEKKIFWEFDFFFNYHRLFNTDTDVEY